MRNLLNFFLKYNYWLLFILLEGISFLLMFRFNNYQQSVFFTSANELIGTVYKVSGDVLSYFHLKEENEILLDKTVWLEHKISLLEKKISDLKDDTTLYTSLYKEQGDFTVFKAHVIKNSLNQPDNYITIDKGSLDGIKPEMGVINANGVVGIVYKTSPHYALVISLLNSKSNLSCKIAGKEYFGYLKWDEGDTRYAYLKDLPRHAEFQVGDSIVTSGYSSVFPRGILVGRIDKMSDSNDGLSYKLRVKLAANFGKIGNVRVISLKNKEEQLDLEKTSK